MRKFLVKTALAALLSVVSIIAVYFLTFMFTLSGPGLASEVFYVIEKADHNSRKSAVILGDSVCNQLWPQKEDSANISHLGCNQAITTAGTYILLRKYLANNPQTETVYYIIRPQSLGNDMNLNYTYQYFVIPFMNDENADIIDDETRQKLYDKFGKFFVENSYVKSFLLNNNLFMTQYINHVKTKTEKKYTHRLSRTAVIYLPKIRELCREHNVKLKVLPLPLPDNEENYGWEKFDDDVREYGLDDILGDFTKKIHYCPEELYVDGSHFKREILEQRIDELRSYVME